MIQIHSINRYYKIFIVCISTPTSVRPSLCMVKSIQLKHEAQPTFLPAESPIVANWAGPETTKKDVCSFESLLHSLKLTFSPRNIGRAPKRNSSYNNGFSGAMLVSGSVISQFKFNWSLTSLSPALAFQYEHAICWKQPFPAEYEKAGKLSHKQILMMCVASNHHINTLIPLFFSQNRGIYIDSITNHHLGVSKNMGKPPNHPFVHRVFHYKPSILGEKTLFLETPIWGHDHIYGWSFAKSPYPTWRLGVYRKAQRCMCLWNSMINGSKI